MRFLRYLPLAALMFVGACDQEASITNVARPPLAFIRYVHAVPDFGPTDFKFVDAIEYSPSYANTTYRTVGIYQGVRAGSRQWKVFRNSSNIAETQTVLAEGTTNFVAGQYYTILHTGFANAANGTPAQNVVLLDDTRPDQNAGLHISVVNAVGSASQDVYICRPNTLAITAGDAQTAAANANVANAVAVKVTDDCGYDVAGDSVRFVASGGGSVGSAVALTSATGTASSTWRLGTTGAQSLTVSAPTIAGQTVTATIAPIATLVITPPASSNLIVGGTLQLAAVARDAGNNIIGSAGAITWSSSNTARATVSAAGLVTAVVPATVGTGAVGSVYIRAVAEGIRDSVLLNIDWPSTIMAGAIASLRSVDASDASIMTTESFGNIAGGSPSLVAGVAVGTRSAYIARAALGRFTIRTANAGTTVLSAAATPIAGVAGTAATDPVGGYNIAGTQYSAFIFPRSVAGSAAPAAMTTPAVLLIPDRQPPRTVPE
jgi:hypothetical protein